MARVSEFKPTSKTGISTLTTKAGEKHYYVDFMIDNRRFQKKNFTKFFGCSSLKQTADKLDEVKTMIRQGKDPFSKSKNNIETIVLEMIANKKPKFSETKDNSHYKRSLELFFNKYVNPVIGHLKIENVTHKHVRKIMDGMTHLGKSNKLLLKVLCFDLFEKKFRNGEIRTNPFYDLDYGLATQKKPLDVRLNEPIEEVAKKLYNSAMNFQLSHRVLFLISVMLGRRIGEIYHLTFEHIKKTKSGIWYVLTDEIITKTSVVEKYPLPKEVVELLPDEVLDEEYKDTKLFTFCLSNIFPKYLKLIENADIDINKGYKLTSHDNRNLFVSIMTEHNVDSSVADACISHVIKGTKGIYLTVTFDKKIEIFNKYWDILRS